MAFELRDITSRYKGVFSRRPLLLLGAGNAFLLLGVFGTLLVADRYFSHEWTSDFDPVGPASVSGVLRVSFHGSSETPSDRRTSQTGLSHAAVWVRGPNYESIADNDIRGFVDGRFKFARNQATQVHVRLGRRLNGAFAGGWELCRILHRWDDVELPPASTVTGARLELDIEVGPERELELFLYEMRKDWGPGGGGVHRDNGGPPAEGEVWWNESRRGVAMWGMPGAGFASDVHPDADTPAAALARGRYVPRAETVGFESPALAAYIDKRVSAGEPLLFMIKLSDYQEDLRGTLLNVYSSNHGDTRNTANRPRLRLEWISRSEVFQVERHITLEHGRTALLPRISAPDSTMVSATFIPDEGSASPRLVVRGGKGGEVEEFRQAAIPVKGDWDWVQVMLDAHVNPTPLGEPFVASIRDTWVTTGPPEEQEVLWEFISPSGVRHEAPGEYAGSFEWEVRFLPDELGRWRYVWRQTFTGDLFESAVGVFDVTPGRKEDLEEKMRLFVERVQESELSAGSQRINQFGEELMRFERAFMSLETPVFFRDGEPDQEKDTAELLDTAREALSGIRPYGSRLWLEGDGPGFK